MKILRIAVSLLLASSASILLAQRPVPAKDPAQPTPTEPLIVDVHPSPYRPKIVYKTNISNQRFDMRNATIFDMIEFAYGLGEQDDDRENAAIVGGPTWIDFDRFEVSAKIPSLKPPTYLGGPTDPANPVENPDDQMRPVVRRVLAERFHLKYHTENRPLPGYVVTVAKEGPSWLRRRTQRLRTNATVCGIRRIRSSTPSAVPPRAWGSLCLPLTRRFLIRSWTARALRSHTISR